MRQGCWTGTQMWLCTCVPQQPASSARVCSAHLCTEPQSGTSFSAPRVFSDSQSLGCLAPCNKNSGTSPDGCFILWGSQRAHSASPCRTVPPGAASATTLLPTLAPWSPWPRSTPPLHPALAFPCSFWCRWPAGLINKHFCSRPLWRAPPHPACSEPTSQPARTHPPYPTPCLSSSRSAEG